MFLSRNKIRKNVHTNTWHQLKNQQNHIATKAQQNHKTFAHIQEPYASLITTRSVTIAIDQNVQL
jgi:hypothetical protein